jgi:hypothetical protein
MRLRYHLIGARRSLGKMPSVPSPSYAGGRMARFPGSLVLLRKVQYGYRFLPPRDPGKKVVAEIPPSTLLSLDSFVAFGNLSGGSHNFLAYPQASISKMILQTSQALGLSLGAFALRTLANVFSHLGYVSVRHTLLQICTTLISSCMETNTATTQTEICRYAPSTKSMSWSEQDC